MNRLARCASVIALAATAIGASATEPPPPRQARLVELVRQDCGSCHGMTMKGGLGPSLEPATLADRDTDQLRHVILHGRPGTPMPPWKAFLTEDEARWIAERLKQGLPR